VVLVRAIAWQALSDKRTLLGFPIVLGATVEVGDTWVRWRSQPRRVRTKMPRTALHRAGSKARRKRMR